MSDLLEKIQQKQKEIQAKAQALESQEFQDKVALFREWSVRLPILQKEIEEILGEGVFPIEGANLFTS